MKYVYAIMLLNEVKTPVTKENMIKVLEAAKIVPDIDRIDSLMESIEGMDIKKAMETSIKQKTVDIEPDDTDLKPESKKEEKEEESADENMGMGFDSLFGK